MEDFSSKYTAGSCKSIYAITSLRDNNILRINLQENGLFSNQIIHIQDILNTLTSLPTSPPAPDHIGDIFKRPFSA